MGSKLDFSDFEITLGEKVRRVLVVTPIAPIRVGRERLVAIGDGDPSSPVDDEIVERLASWPSSVGVLLLRSWCGDESRSWGFADDLTADEVAQLGVALTRSQLLFFRRILARGLHAMVATDLTAREFDAMRQGTMTLSQRFAEQARGVGLSAAEQVDRWILEHFSLWTTRPFEEFVAHGLPDLFNLADKHAETLRELRAQL